MSLRKCKKQSLQLQKKTHIGEEKTSLLSPSVRIMMERLCLRNVAHSVLCMILTKAECPIQSQKIQMM